MNFLSRCLHKIGGRKGDSEAASSLTTWTGAVNKGRKLRDCPFVVFDTELSGLDRKKDFIVSIGALKMTGQIIHMSRDYYRLVKPAGELTRESVEIHEITPGELETKESMEQVLPGFLDFIRDSVLVGHFLNIDLRFVNRELKQRYRSRLRNYAVDTHTVHQWLGEHGDAFRKHYQGGSTKTDLFSVATCYGITVEAAHNALIDAFITAQLFQKFLYFLEAEGIHTLGDLLEIGRA